MSAVELPADGRLHSVTWTTAGGVTTCYVDGEPWSSWSAERRMRDRLRRWFWRAVIASLITLPVAVYDLSGLKAARERRNR